MAVVSAYLLLNFEKKLMPKKTDDLASILTSLDAYSQRALSTHSHVLMKLIGAQVAPSKIMLKTAAPNAVMWRGWTYIFSISGPDFANRLQSE